MTRITTFAAACSAAALFATGALAAEPLTASIGGYMHIGVGLTDDIDGTGSEDKVGVLRDGEIHFKFKGSSDNGLTFDGRVELEAFGDSDQIDENWARVSGSFGSVMIGGNDEVKTEMAAGVIYSPGTKIGYYDDDVLQASDLGGIDSVGDDLGIHYQTPSFYGFSAGASYIADSNSDGANDAYYAASGDEAYSLALRYDGAFGDVSYAVAGGWLSIDSASDDSYNVGGEASYAGFTLGAYWEQNLDASNDYAVGLAYATGPWTVAGGYSLIEENGAPDTDTFAGWVTYALAPGVSTSAGVAHSDNGVETGYNAMAWMSLNF